MADRRLEGGAGLLYRSGRKEEDMKAVGWIVIGFLFRACMMIIFFRWLVERTIDKTPISKKDLYEYEFVRRMRKKK